eukprot:SAG31_NODE_6506_length_1992_cov_2.123085_2_plen_111_part_00
MAASSSSQTRFTVVSSGESEEVQALRLELEHLRKDLAKAAPQHVAAELAHSTSSNALAPIPAEVPPLSLNCRPTPDMEKLKVMLISSSDDSTMAVTATKSKVGALGMVSD